MDQQQYLERETLANFRPIFRREADKAKGEIFPTIWYQSTLEMTSIQQSIMAKSVLVAESPLLKYVDLEATLSVMNRSNCTLEGQQHLAPTGERLKTTSVFCC
jgi:hypothetical protein